VAKLTAEVERAREQQARLGTEREGLIAERAQLIAQAGTLKGELKAHQEEIARLREAKNQSAEQLRTLREQLDHGAVIHTAAMSKAREEFAEAEKQWLEKLAKLKSTAATFRDAYQEKDGELVERDKNLAGLTAQLAENQRELERLHETHRALASVVEAERDTSALDKRLGSIEEQEQHSSKRIARQLDVLDEIKERLGKHESLLERIGDAMARRTEAEIANAKVGVPQQLAMWLMAKPMRLAGAATVLFILLGLGVVLGASLGGDSGGTARAATVAPETASEVGADADVQPPAEARAAEPAPEAAAPAPPEPEATADAPELPAAAAPETAAAPKKARSEDDRKTLRKKLVTAFGKKRWSEVVSLGFEMRESFTLDWEAEWKLAEALRNAGKPEAAAAYRDFAAHFPTNAYTDDALFNAGAMLMKAGKAGDGRPLLERVAADAKSSLADDAKKLLAKK
jgi:TolA-binding protein